PNNYHMYIDQDVAWNGSSSAVITAKRKDVRSDGSGSIWQAARADPFRGKRLRISAHIRTEDVPVSAGLWLRVDDLQGLAMLLRFPPWDAIGSTTDWTEYTLVVDIPEHAARIAYGIHLFGGGTLWVDDISIDTVTRDVALTAGHFPLPLDRS